MRLNADLTATREALKRIAESGSDLSRPLTIDFFVAVPSAAVGRMVSVRPAELGFSTSTECDDKTGDWTCYCTKTLIPDLLTVVAIERQLDQIAQGVGGHIDGFGSFGNADARCD